MAETSARFPVAIELKAAGATDAGLIARLHRLCFADAWSADSVRDLLASPCVFARVAWRTASGGQERNGGAAVGFVIHRIVGGEAELMALAVAPDQRGRGLGRRLLTFALAQVAAAGVRAMFLEVAIDNPAAQNLYVGHGFSQVGRRLAYYQMRDGRRVDALVFRRKFSPAAMGRA